MTRSRPILRPATVAACAAAALAWSPAARAQEAPASRAWSLPVAGPGRFAAVHGERATVMGYPDAGLEVWAWPLQLLSGYQLRFRTPDRVAPLEARPLLARIEQGPSETVRVYVGPDFTVRERLFTPPHAPGAILTYEVEGRPDVRIEARFQPSLDLMWPGALGGQSLGWDAALNGYVEKEPVHGFEAVIRSPQAVAHDPTTNSATARPEATALVLAPRAEADGVRRARLFVAADALGPAEGHAGSERLSLALERREGEFRREAAAADDALRAEASEIVTPDVELNRALAASVAALDKAWVCQPELGCGLVAGYGPSRPGRRPQYAWFFAGDGLVGVEGLLAAGRFERARDELAFIARYQNRANGMIWHEMSLSAPLIDWEKRYPYMFVHVDITLQYLATLATYLDATGDAAFLKAHRAGILAAWRYAGSLVDPKTGLPTIPAGKQGQNEQDVLRDDVRLSSAWIDAADGFAKVARGMGEARLAREGDRAAARARAALRPGVWDAQQGFWLGGHRSDGSVVHDERSDAARLLLQDVLTSEQRDAALDRLSSPAFLTDWGVRSLSAEAATYDPNAYGAGSVWALGTSSTATAFYRSHRPQAGWEAWGGLKAWASLDSPGRVHEVLAGDLFHPELESVPEQTWSSAGFLTGFVGGVLGLEPRATAHALTFAPHLPADWGELTVRRLRVGASRIDLHLTRDAGGMVLEVRNAGPALDLDFDPEIPLGARLLGAEVDGAPAAAVLEPRDQDQHARLKAVVRAGVTRVAVRYAGGVRLAVPSTPPRPGDPSRDLKLASTRWSDGALSVDAYVADADHAAVDLLTSLEVTAVEGASVTATAGRGYRLTFPAPPSGASGYTRLHARLLLRERAGGAAD